MKIKILLLLVVILLHQTIAAQKVVEPYKISDNLYVISDLGGGNVAFLVTRKGILVVDAGSSPANAEKIISMIKEISDKSIKYLILTHFHGDHIYGLSAFPEDVKIIAHEKLAENNSLLNEEKLNQYINDIIPKHLKNLKVKMDFIDDDANEEYIKLEKDFKNNQAYLQDLKKIKFREPDKTFTDYFKIKLADERIILEYPEPGHTSDNIVVKFSNHNVIHTGDLVFNGSFPFLIKEHGVDVYNWTQILDDLFKENISKVIPGHGEVASKRALKEQADYFRKLASKINTLMLEGYKLEEIKQKIKPDEFALKGNEEQLPINIEVIYSELYLGGERTREIWEF